MTFHNEGTQPERPTQVPQVGGEDLLRGMLQELVQEALNREFEKFVGAGPWQRSSERKGWRNGHKPRQYLLISPEARLDRTWTRLRHSAA